MVDTIGPMVSGHDDPRPGLGPAHILGGAAGGAVTGFIAGAVGAVTGLDEARPAFLMVGVVAAALVAVVVDTFHEGKKLGLARQTSRAWRHVLPDRVAALLNGFDLGLGWSTRIYFTSYAVALLAAIASAHALSGAAIGASFGAARALFVVMARHRSGGTLSIDSIAERRRPVVAMNAVALFQFAVVAGFAARRVL